MCELLLPSCNITRIFAVCSQLEEAVMDMVYFLPLYPSVFYIGLQRACCTEEVTWP